MPRRVSLTERILSLVRDNPELHRHNLPSLQDRGTDAYPYHEHVVDAWLRRYWQYLQSRYGDHGAGGDLGCDEHLIYLDLSTAIARLPEEERLVITLWAERFSDVEIQTRLITRHALCELQAEGPLPPAPTPREVLRRAKRRLSQLLRGVEVET